MNQFLKKLATYFFIASLVGCSNTIKHNDVVKPKEYAYLSTYINKDIRWGGDEWFDFVTHLNDKHLTELSLEWGILNKSSPGINVNWLGKQEILTVGNPKIALDSIGGRQNSVKLLQKAINGSRYFTKDMFEKNVKWNDIVIWVNEKNGISSLKSYSGSFEAERALINRCFVNNWDRLSSAQRKSVIDNSSLRNISAQDKVAIIAAKGTIALATLNATVAVSGFAFYTTMSSVIAATSSVIGVTLPFAVYTGASTAVGTLTGPIGWSLLAASSAGLGLYALAPDTQQVSRMVMSLHILKVKVLEDSGFNG